MKYFSILPLILFIGTAFSTVNAQPLTRGNTYFNLSSNYEHFFETDIDDGGEFSLNRFGVDASADYQVLEKLGLSFSAGYSFLDFDFNGDNGFAGLDPWDNLNKIRLGTRLDYKASNKVTTTVGFFTGYYGESGADFSDSLTYGGYLGVLYTFNRSFLLGGGVFMTTQIEDDFRVYPLILLRWQISDKLLLSNIDPSIRTTIGPGAKLEYRPGNNLGIALNIAYQSDRFRLDDEGTAPGGVGEFSSLPVWLSAGYEISKNVELELFSGVAFFGELELDDRDGNNIDEEDFDPSIFLGGGFKLKL